MSTCRVVTTFPVVLISDDDEMSGGAQHAAATAGVKKPAGDPDPGAAAAAAAAAKNDAGLVFYEKLRAASAKLGEKVAAMTAERDCNASAAARLYALAEKCRAALG